MLERAALVLPLLSVQLAQPFHPSRLRPAGVYISPPPGGGRPKAFETFQTFQAFRCQRRITEHNQDEGDAKPGEGEYEGDAKEMQRLSTGHAKEL